MVMEDTLHMPKLSRFSLALAAVVLLGGCATGGANFSCPAPEGVTCMSPQEIYEATNRLPHLEDGVTQGKPAALPVTAAGSALMVGGAQSQLPLTTRGRALVFADRGLRATSPGVPLRTQAEVMRIWVSPWTDAAGDLHMAGYVYTEISPRSWSLGVTADSATSQRFNPNAAWRLAPEPHKGG